jgi:hypothetical protein
MGAHLIDGEFQSDKYPTTPRGKVPLSVKDKTAQDLLWEYARRRRAVDAEFSDDLEAALTLAGFERAPSHSVAVDGIQPEEGIELWGRAMRQEDGTYQCLANVHGALCRVEVNITFASLR